MNDATQPVSPPHAKIQFSLGLMLGAMLYASALATVTINISGDHWNPFQKGAAYVVSIASVVGFTALSKLRGKFAAYLLLAPLMFVAATVAGTMFHGDSREAVQLPTPLISTTPAAPNSSASPSATVPATTPVPKAVPGIDNSPRATPSPLSGGNLGK